LVSRQLAELKTSASTCSPVLRRCSSTWASARSFRVSACVCQLAVQPGDLGLRAAHARQTVLDDKFAVLAQHNDVLDAQAPDGVDLGRS
jgi:hypothetical protein